MDVLLPDGSIGRFPDDMPETEIRTVLMKQFPREQAAKPAAPKAANKTGALEASTAGAAAGLTGNFFDELASGVMTPIELGIGAYTGEDAGKGLDDRVGDAYGRALKKNRDYEATAREEHPVAATVGDVGGGLALGGTAAANGLTLMRAPAQAATTAMGQVGQTASMLGRAGAEGAAYGAAYGAGSGDGAGDRFDRALQGGAIGGAVGGGLGAAAAGAGALARSGATPITGWVAPDRAVETALLRSLQRSGQTPQQITQALAAARSEGQGVYTMADALGNSAQRQLSSIARSPGDGRQMVIDTLQSRQAGQGERLSSAVDEAFGATGTARQTTADLTRQARTDSRPLYEEAYQMGPVHNDRIAQFLDDPIAQQGLFRGVEVQRLEALADGVPFNPSDMAITGFSDAGDPIMGAVPNMRTLQAVKVGLDDILEGYRDATTGRLNLDTRGQAIDRVRRAFLEQIDAVNPTYGLARAAYAGPASVTNDVRFGGQAATRGRADDNIQQFASRPGPNQQGWRQGYADKVNEGIERAAFGADKSRPFTSMKSQAERDAYALPGRGDRLERQIGREQRMYETRHEALGGSSTSKNLNDETDMAMVDPAMIGNLLSGRYLAALQSFTHQTMMQLRGMPDGVRQRLATQLLQTNPDRAGAALAQALARGDELTNAQVAAIRSIAQQGGQRTGTSR